MLATYDPQLVVVTWGMIIAGYADGEMVTAEYDEDAFTVKTGTQGDTVHIRSANLNATATVTLQQSSPINSVLSTLAALDRIPGNNVVRPFQIKDLNGDTVIASPAARIQRVAASPFSNDSENRQWSFLLYKARVHIGGSIVVAP